MWTVENRGSYDRGGLRYPSDVTDDEWVFKLFDDRIPVGLNPIAVLTRRRVQPRPKRLIVEIGWQRTNCSKDSVKMTLTQKFGIYVAEYTPLD